MHTLDCQISFSRGNQSGLFSVVKGSFHFRLGTGGHLPLGLGSHTIK